MGARVAIRVPVCYNRASKSTREICLTSATLPLEVATQDQAKVFKRAFALLEEGIKQHVFPGASVAVTSQNALVAHHGFGHYTYEKKARAVDAESIFDIASLTKVVATTAMAMLLHERGQLDVDSYVIGMLPEFALGDERREEVTFRMLLAHSSGLPAWVPLYKRAQNKATMLQMAAETPFASDPGSRAEYSDIGFILLGEALEELSGSPLDSFCELDIFKRLEMESTHFNPEKEL